MTRRTFLELSALPALAGVGAAQPSKLKVRTSQEIKASGLSVGFETLDRKMFEPERTYPLLGKLGVKWARCQTGWARTETSKGVYDFAWLDGVVDSLRALGIEPWFNLGYGNRLYSPGANESAVGWHPLTTPEARQAWEKYVGKLASHFRGRVKYWELWNEPNGATFWRPDPASAKGYTDLVKLTAPVVRRTIPGAILIGGAFAGIPGVMPYAEACFDQGLAGLVDKISYHPYRAQPEVNYRSDYESLRALVYRYRPGMGLWQGENGAPSADGSAGALGKLHWDEQLQARWLIRRILVDLTLGVELTSYFHTVDMVNYATSRASTGATNAKGLIRATDYGPKLSYFAYQNICALFDSDTKRHDYVLDFSDITPALEPAAAWSASFVRKGRPIYAYWYPGDLQAGWSPHKTHLALWSDNQAPLDKPVLVNLMNGSIEPIANAEKKNGFWQIDNLPLENYPMLVTDLSVVS